MKTIKIYLSIIDSENKWLTKIYLDFDEVVENLLDLFSNKKCLAIIHIGFNKQEKKYLDSVKSCFISGLLISEEAINHLAKEIETSCVGIHYCNMHIVRKGWNHSFTYEEIANKCTVIVKKEESIIKNRRTKDWLLNLINTDKDLVDVMQKLNIFNDREYLKYEACLDDSNRRKAGISRMNILSGANISIDNIIMFLKYAPPWILLRNIENCGFSNRIMNSFHINKIITINDIISLGEGVLSFKSLGKKSYAELKERLYILLTKEAIYLSAHNNSGSKQNINNIYFNRFDKIDNFDNLLNKEVRLYPIKNMIENTFKILTERERKVLEFRMGIHQKALTLLEIGEILNVTRERIRQIEKRAMDKCITFQYWLKKASTFIEELLSGRKQALYLSSLAIENSWFEGCEVFCQFIEYLLRAYKSQKFNIIEIDGNYAISKIDQNTFEYLHTSLIKELRSLIGNGIEVSYAKDVITVSTPEKYGDISEILWDTIRKESIIRKNQNGVEILLAVNNNLTDFVITTLNESESPMHYKEITAKISKDKGLIVNERRVHNIATSLAYLFDRGIYGLRKHLLLNEYEIEKIKCTAEDLICSSSRQWHCSEIAEEIKESGLLPYDKVNSHIVDIVLKIASTEIEDLGRLVWQQKSNLREIGQARIDIQQAIVSILQDNGKPMSNSEIIERIQKDRGVSANIQIFSRYPVIKIDESLWGLIDRDLPFSTDITNFIVNTIAEKLNEIQIGIHLSEIYSKCPELESIENTGINPLLIASIGTAKGIYKMDIANYIYIPTWEGSRRPTLRNATKEVLSKYGKSGIDFNNLKREVQEKISRNISSQVLSGSLNAIESAVYNPESEIWTYNDIEEKMDDDD